ncbi:MAG: efflux transporter periplasmic adaptor subunit, partial [Cyanobacteria bacterium J06597_16]
TGLTVDDKTEVVTGLEGHEQIVLSAAEGLPENRRNIGGGPGGPGGARGGSGPGGGGPGSGAPRDSGAPRGGG